MLRRGTVTIKELFDKAREKTSENSLLADVEQVLSVHNPLDMVILSGQGEEVYLTFKNLLQGFAMGASNGEAEHDVAVYVDATRSLGVIREVLVEEFGLELPEMVVRPFFDEALELGILKEVWTGPHGTEVMLEDSPYDLKVRIIKAPSGDAPEKVRREWIGVEFFARYLPGPQPIRTLVSRRLVFVRETYVVLGSLAVQQLARKSPEAAAWFHQHVNLNRELTFDAECIQVLDAN